MIVLINYESSNLSFTAEIIVETRSYVYVLYILCVYVGVSA